MKSFRTTWICTAAMAVAMTIAAAQASASDEEGVTKATEQFYVALNALFTGDGAPMEAVWSHTDDVTYMGPDGTLLTGWEQVRAAWQKQAAMKLGGHIAPESVRIILGKDLAAEFNFEKGTNTNADGKTAAVSIRSSKVFRNESGTWKLISHHADPLPFLK